MISKAYNEHHEQKQLSSDEVRDTIIETASHRNILSHNIPSSSTSHNGGTASTATSASSSSDCSSQYQFNFEDARPMDDQVGGFSSSRGNDSKQILRLEMPISRSTTSTTGTTTAGTNVILKPLSPDSRGITEVAVYEILEELSTDDYPQQRDKGDCCRRGGGDGGSSAVADDIYCYCYLCTLWRVLFQRNDRVSSQEEEAIIPLLPYATESEFESLKGLLAFTSPYYGVLKQRPQDPFHPRNATAATTTITTTTKSEINNTTLLSPSSPPSYLILSDATTKFRKPCVIDIKMGQQTYDPYATLKKQIYEREKYPQQELFGFRIVGMRVLTPTASCDGAAPIRANEVEDQCADNDSKGYRVFDKNFGRGLTTRLSVLDALRSYFGMKCHVTDWVGECSGDSGCANGPGEVQHITKDKDDGIAKKHLKNDAIVDSNYNNRHGIISSVLSQLKELQQWHLHKNKSFSFYASSILIVYEGDTTAVATRDTTTATPRRLQRNDCHQQHQESEHKLPELKIIDLAHIDRQNGGDVGYMHGIENLISMLDEILRDEA